MPLSTAITDVCRDHFGAYRGHGKWSPPNRCDSCPLREPCVAHGAAPAHTFEQLVDARATFHREALAILGEVAP